MLLQALQATRESWSAKIHDFLDADEDEIYRRCVRVALADPVTARLVGKRPGTDAATIAGELNSPVYRHFATGETSPYLRRQFERARGQLDEAQRKHREAAESSSWSWWAVTLLLTLGIVVTLALFGSALLTVWPILLAAVSARSFRNPFLSNLRHCLRAAGYAGVWTLARFRLGVSAAEWGEALGLEGARTTARRIVRLRLGDDVDSLFIPDMEDELGLRDSDAVIETEARRQLDRKLAHLKHGTIAVSGPRGSGKTTLLEMASNRADFGFTVRAPATYTPQEFLLTLSVRLCREYMRDQGYAPPEFAKATALSRLFQRARHRAARLGWWTAFAAPACVLLALGLSGSARSLYHRYTHALAQAAREIADKISDIFLQIIHGQAVAGSVVILLLAITCWKLRKQDWLPAFVGNTCSRATRLLGFLLIGAAIYSVLLDMAGATVHLSLQPPTIRIDQPAHPPVLAMPPPGTVGRIAALTAVWVLFRVLRSVEFDWPFGRRHINLQSSFGPLATAAGVALLLYLAHNPHTHSILADSQNPLRIAGLVLGSMLVKVGNWTPGKEEPELVTRCREHLYRLQTTQSMTNGLSTTAQLLGLGSSHTTSVSTLPPNFPELVDSFRTLLADIAKAKHATGQTVVIAIDEVDRLGTDTKALAFLSEIKAVLGIPHMHFLISIADDVGASFVRRGLPHRDVTDSSLDDIVHVQPVTLTESTEILAERSSALTASYTMLAHSLSGGALRDLHRYANQIAEMQAKSESHELAEISRHLILEELSETLAGFRTLLSKRQWSRDTSGVLTAFRTLGGCLRDSCPCTEATLQPALAQFAFHAAADRPSQPAPHELADDTAQLIDEASAYAYFSLTLLEIFSAEGLDRRTVQAAEQGFDGDPERLAEARQELGVSPYSARPLIESIRKAWSLPLSPSVSSRIPQPRSGGCPRHPAGR
ncbi:hypothetical protein ACFRSX_32665 [Streptomyces goshikiensis]|uniref:hypothetical protein n=1 Tax=Streptomyces TaxID=1883 RepID=UPI000C27DC8E|nr:hypothetical protein [Streptomyces sp. CB02120-2]PJN14536.1 hypothetical protein CG724_33115 [Streptomyces sp. CB02120-2]